jgi:sugar lactone lactonase YvrE
MFRTKVKKSLSAALVSLILVACGGADNGSAGNGADAISNPGTGQPEPVYKTELSLVAGSIGGPGNLDGLGTAARFSEPGNTALDADGNLYVADGFTVRKIAPDGMTTTFAGTGVQGNADGTAQTARFVGPTHLAFDAAGNLYVTDLPGFGFDPSNPYGPAIRKITRDGTVSTLAGGTPAANAQAIDGKGQDAKFVSIAGLGIDKSGNLYVRDSNKVRKIAPDGVVSTVAVFTFGDMYSLGNVNNVAVDSSGNVYAANTGTIWKISPAGEISRIELPSHPIFGIAGISADANGNLYILRTPIALLAAEIFRIDANGTITKLSAAATTLNPANSDNPSSWPRGQYQITADGQGGFYVSDSGSHTIRKVGASGASAPLAGLAVQYGSADAIGDQARFGGGYVDIFAAIAGDASGNVYVADRFNSSVRKIAPGGVVTTLAGLSGSAGFVDGTGQDARFLSPAGIAVDLAGNVYVTDITEPGTVVRHLSVIKKITPAGKVTSLAGTPYTSDAVGFGGLGSMDGQGSNAKFYDPAGLAVDAAGNIYVADTLNRTIRKITPEGLVSTLAGTAGQIGSADGSGAAARFSGPISIAVDSTGSLYVLDAGYYSPDSRSAIIRKITQDGMVTTIAGTWGMSGSADGIGAAARFDSPRGLTVDAAGNVYVADTGNHVIRRISPAGVVTTLAGNPGSQGIRLGPSPVSLGSPTSVSFAAPHFLIIRDGASVLRLTLP